MDIQQPLKDKLLPVNCIEFFLIAKIRNRAAYLFTVAQIFNPPHRRFVIGRTLLAAGRWQVKNLRYSRPQVCATGRGPRAPQGTARAMAFAISLASARARRVSC